MTKKNAAKKTKKTTTKVKRTIEVGDSLPTRPEYTDSNCPFCGSPGIYDHGEMDGEVLWFINCSNCRGGVGPFGRRSDCTRAWDRRPK